MNVERQINHWITSAEEDFQIATLLFNDKREIHCLFYCHLVLEKMIKAHIAKQTKKTPPRIHNLISLAEKGLIELDEPTKYFFNAMHN